MNLETIENDLNAVLSEYFVEVTYPKNSLFVVGCSTSEIRGVWKGTGSSLEVGQTVYETVMKFLQPRGIAVAIQGCEHINRSMLMERSIAEHFGYEEVAVVPAMHAGGGTQVAAYQAMSDPVEVEHIQAFGGIDIGGTEIGMHVKFVQIPVRTNQRQVGDAIITCLKSRPKLVGGSRSQYEFTKNNLLE
ncbi:TIGR01440 family protein [Lentilactobacillus sp. SPB1-3]|uniref:TIGR01440 family protein n=1 Tax=Lentilactobacillus terminaliae TaxID=3003483 RepID=A0ACD5DED8_9LACO|nr:TIGR01440 family protein [Lentilactobacillus sp. SPB1-3]MCZ0976271.1 TIGR01440 family protein [Lentilactobacillus sp. SPB1-3]